MDNKNQPPENLRPFKVFAIEKGTVIDHIDVGQAIKIIRLLNLAAENRVVTVGLNLSSDKHKLKDLIKVENKELTPEEINRVAIFAPNASINIIRDYKVADKFEVELPKIIEHVIVCPNPKCITNNDETDTKFHVQPNGKELKVKCHYCEKIFAQKEIREYKNN